MKKIVRYVIPFIVAIILLSLIPDEKTSAGSGAIINGKLRSWGYTEKITKNLSSSSYTLNVTADEAISFSSSDSSIASVNSSGVVTLKSGGTCEISIKGSGKHKISYIFIITDDVSNNITVSGSQGDTSIKKLVLDENVAEIDDESYMGCKNLKKITLNANTLKSIGRDAFKGIHKKAKFYIVSLSNEKYLRLVDKLKKAGAEKATFKMLYGEMIDP